MFNNAKDRLITIVVHILVWILLIFVFFMYPPLAGTGAKLPDAFWVKQGIHITLMIIAFYINAYYLVPKLLINEKGIFPFIACIILMSLVCSFILARVDNWLDLSEQLEKAFGKKMWPNLYVDFFGLMTTLLVLGISTSVSLIQNWHRDAKARQEFESQQTITELSFLKAQIHPHFFFNTLNSIYALSYIDVETSRTALLKLSRMMRYLLYETQQNTTMLSRELEFIKDYVEIMKLRLKSNTIVLFKLPDSPEEMPIAPMMLLPFVENAFKHGIDDLENGTIKIIIDQITNGLELTVKNNTFSKEETPEKKINDKGIGLANTRRRLDLLYKDKHALTIRNDAQANEYELNLKLILV